MNFGIDYVAAKETGNYFKHGLMLLLDKTTPHMNECQEQCQSMNWKQGETPQKSIQLAITG